jgi:glycosyltransferase involved in cell wall biosynthesis
MTVYNTARYLCAAVESILGQTFGDFEFIIIDDGSTDGSTDILRECESKDARIRLVSRPNTGIVRAANDGIALARGEYLARMDSDDVSVPHRFERQVAYLDAHPECVLVGSRITMIDPYGSPFLVSGHKLTHEEIDAELLTTAGGYALVQPTTMMRLAAVQQVGAYRGTHQVSEDHDLFVRLAEVGKVANLEEPRLWYRRHYKSTTLSQFRQMRQTKERILREAYARRGMTFPADWKFVPWEPPPLREQLRQWGWAAIKAGNLGVARRHALGVVARAPLSPAAWKLMYCAVRGR